MREPRYIKVTLHADVRRFNAAMRYLSRVADHSAKAAKKANSSLRRYWRGEHMHAQSPAASAMHAAYDRKRRARARRRRNRG